MNTHHECTVQRHQWCRNEPFRMECGFEFPALDIAYFTAGKLNETASNVVWVCPPLPASHDVFAWWPQLFGPGKFFDPEKYFVVCVAMLGSAYGTTGPLSHDPKGIPYLHRFPEGITVRDIARVTGTVREHLGIDKVHTLVAPSMGGAVGLEWAIEEPDRFDHVVLMACNAVTSPWGVAWNESQRMIIEADSSWRSDHVAAGMNGMKAARAMAILSYRSCLAYQQQQAGRNRSGHQRAATYQRFKGDELASRPFNAFSYYALTSAMDTHDVGRGRGGVAAALSRLRTRLLAIGFDSDLRYPPDQQQRIAALASAGEFVGLKTIWGHDAFLIEREKLISVLNHFYEAANPPRLPSTEVVP